LSSNVFDLSLGIREKSGGTSRQRVRLARAIDVGTVKDLMRRLRPFAVLLAMAAITLLSGCVYLRLLQLKLQLGRFDQNFEVVDRDGLVLTFKHPVLLDRDLHEFFKWTPDATERVGTAERWRFRWVKDSLANTEEPHPAELTFDALFIDHKLVKLSAPETFFAATIPKQLAVAAVRSLGHAQIDENKRQASSAISTQALEDAAAEQFLSKDGIRKALGMPVEQRGQLDSPQWYYRFRPASSHQTFASNGMVDMTFTFDPATNRVRLMRGKTAFGEVVFDTTKTAQGGAMHVGM
jgi:hypothetical protein